jgi:uncharacterized protein (DUF433 family)
MASVEQLLAGPGAGMESSPKVCGDEPRIWGTSIPVWTLEQARRPGMTEGEILDAYPGLRAADPVNAWAFVAEHAEATSRQIQENEGAWPAARRPLPKRFRSIISRTSTPRPYPQSPGRAGSL